MDDSTKIMNISFKNFPPLTGARIKFRDAANNSPGLIWMAGTDGLCYWFNRGWLEFTGRTMEQELGNGWTEGVYPQDFQPCVDKYLKHFEAREEFLLEYRLRRSDGQYRWILDSGTPVFDLEGQFLGYNGVCFDIHERKESENVHNEGLQFSLMMHTVTVAMNLSEMRDPYTAGHERRVAEIAVAISAELGFDVSRQQGIRVAGNLHDIGKINIPAEILSKPSKLTDIEYSLVKFHAQASYDVLQHVAFPWPIAEVAFQHHERLDGTGYPRGLKGEEIIMEARILAVADTVEAMSSHRPYRAGLGIEKALAEIERGQDIIYDGTVVDACLKLFRQNGYNIPLSYS